MMLFYFTGNVTIKVDPVPRFAFRGNRSPCPDNHACEVQTLPVAIDFRVALMITSVVSFEDVFSRLRG